MKNWDESLLTAYALGELSENENEFVEEMLARSPDLRRELQEIRGAIELLQIELAGESARNGSGIQKPSPARRRWLAPAAAAAAAVLLFAVWVPDWQRLREAAETPGKAPERLSSLRSLESSAQVEPIPETQTATTAQRAVDGPSEGRSYRTEQDPTPEPAGTKPQDAGAGQIAADEAGEIAGRVLDGTGIPLPGVDVTVRAAGRELEKTTATDNRGRFNVTGVPPGRYQVAASLPGFKEDRRTIELAAGQIAQWNPLLEVGEVGEVVEVIGEPVRIGTLSTAVHSEVSAHRFASEGAPHPAQPGAAGAGRFEAPPMSFFYGVLDPDVAHPAIPQFHTEAYDRIEDNPFIRTDEDPLSTFSIDVDTASYSNVRRFLNDRRLPPPDAVRIEEMINYFSYDYSPPAGEHPFAVHAETASAPWNPAHRLLKIGLKGREIAAEARPPGNFVFLIDVSGSMRPSNKLPLLKRAMKMLIRESMRAKDRVALVVYAGTSGIVLDSTLCEEKDLTLQAIERLQAGGSTNAGAGIQDAYEIARRNFIPGGVNRVILATDGDFNVGVTSQGELTRLIEEKARSGVFLTVLGFGMGNLKDSMMEKLARHGNGNYAYIDDIREARKVLVEQAGGTLMTIAKDVKIQLEFNPERVAAYRLIGYENRVLAHRDFNDDEKAAGDIGASHTVTALYELIPAGAEVPGPTADPLRYQAMSPASGPKSEELLFVKLRYKDPEGEKSRLIEAPVRDSERNFQGASADFRFAAAVAAFGMTLRDSPHRGSADFTLAYTLAEKAIGADLGGYRAEFLQLVKRAQALKLLEESE